MTGPIPPYRGILAPAGVGFAATLHAEWTKLRSVRATAWCLLLAVGLTIGLSSLLAAAGKTDDGPHRTDEFSFVHQALTGDGSITARIRSQDDSHPWAKAGVMIKESLSSGSAYAAMILTPDHGLRMEANFSTDIAGTGAGTPRWLRLTRIATTIAGFTSPDGDTWTRVGTVALAGLPATAQIGLFVTSPINTRLVQGGGRVGIEMTPSNGRAEFDNVSVQPAALAGGSWSRDDVTTDPDHQNNPDFGTFTEATGTLTLTGTGDVSGYGIPSYNPPDARDTVADSLRGVQIGLMAIVALGVVFATSEYKTAMIRGTFAASPRRWRVLVAKAIVVGGTVFAAGLAAATIAFVVAQSILRGRGLTLPAYPSWSLTDPPVLRAVIGTALVMAVLAVFSLAVATILRRSAAAIIVVLGLVLVPQIVGAAAVMPLDAEQWLNRLTPAAGLAIQETRTGLHTAISPWAGFAILCAYTAVALAAACWRQARSDA